MPPTDHDTVRIPYGLPHTNTDHNKVAHASYCTWCGENGFGTENKRNFFDELKNKGIFADSGTVSGRTVRNVIKGYVVRGVTVPF